MQSSQQQWSSIQKILFRFFCCFFFIYIFPFPLDSIPFTTEISLISTKLTAWYFAIFEAYTNFWHKVIPWVGQHILHLKKPITIFSNGSGDTTYDYVQLLTYFFLALLATILWTSIDRNRKSYNTIYFWLRVWVRYYLVAIFLIYGFIKIFHLQMPSPFLSQLVQPFGDKSPMGLAWSFVGYSKAFSAFTGWGEVIAGLFIFFRRTATLGALAGIIVMGNIVAINFCYDVPVKLFSSMLWIMCVCLVVPDIDRLIKIFFLNKSTQPVDISFKLNKKWQRVTRLILKWTFILYSLYSNISQNIKSQKEYGDAMPKINLYGIYNTVTVMRNHDTLPPLDTDTTRWKQLIVQFEKYSMVKMMNDSFRVYNFIIDTVSKKATVYPTSDTLNKSIFNYQSDAVYLTLTGKIKKDSIYMRFKKIDINSFRLLSRGFNWINEYPYNR